MNLRRSSYLFSAATAALVAMLASAALAQTTKPAVFARIDETKAVYDEIAMKIWNYAEVGYKETKSAALLQEQLKNEGFAIEAGVAGIPTAFTASYGSGQPVIVIMGEYDALPGISQEAVPEKKSARA